MPLTTFPVLTAATRYSLACPGSPWAPSPALVCLRLPTTWDQQQKRASAATAFPDAANRPLVGKCGCGRVRYRVADAFLYAANCHCSRCRAATGSAFKPFAGIEREKLELTDGGDALLVVGEEDLNDTRFAACGSLLFSVVRDGAFAHVASPRLH